MCDQDHFEDDLHEYEKRGLITRRQFGVLIGAGACMVLPQVANAVAVTESDLTITTPDGTAEAYFVRPATGTAPGVLVWPDIFGLRGGGRQSVLPGEKVADCCERGEYTDPGFDSAGSGAERDDAHD